MKEQFGADMSSLLQSKGYELFWEIESKEYFGNYEKIYKKGKTEIKFGSDRDFVYVDMRNANVGEWVDLSLLCQRAKLGKEEVLTGPMLLEIMGNSLTVLERTLDDFPSEEIKRLKIERLKRMIPGIFP